MRAIFRFLSIPCSAALVASAAGPARGQCVTTSGVMEADGGTLAGYPSTTTCDLPHNDLVPGSISVQGLSAAAPFLDALANGALDEATIQPFSANLDKNVGQLLGKIVSCALARDVSFSVAGITLRGELGLCKEWKNSRLSSLLPTRKSECLQVVSSCVLARVNAIGARVILSLRASEPALRSLRVNDPELLKLRKAVPVEDHYREHHGTPIPSFQPCR